MKCGLVGSGSLDSPVDPECLISLVGLVGPNDPVTSNCF